MRPGDILHSRTDLLHRIRERKDFREQLAFLLASQIGDVPANYLGNDQQIVPGVLEKHYGSIDWVGNHLEVAEVYRVTPDMSSMVEFAASQLDDTDEIDTSLAPTQCGMVRFDQPLPVKDIRGKTMLINWLVWGPFRDLERKPVTAVWAFNDPRSTPDDTHRELTSLALAESGQDHVDRYLDMIGRYATVGCQFLYNGEPLGPMLTEGSSRHREEVLAEGDQTFPGTNTTRYIHALWLLLNQTVTKVEEEGVDRAARKRAEKMRLPSKVTVIRLRREVSTLGREPGESQVQWQHRWIVRGHWRWQACGPGRTERKRIWINPFVKGPESAPFVQSEKVYSLER